VKHEQDLHRQQLIAQFSEIMSKKYEIGAKEHGGNIWELSTEKLLDEAINEAIDQVVYLLTLKANL
jgi:uncharacterized protein (DUF2249 family)